MKLYVRLTLLLATQIPALLHRPVLWSLSSRTGLLHRQFQELSIPQDNLAPSGIDSHRFQRRGNCMGKRCEANPPQTQSRSQRTSRESNTGASPPHQPMRSRSASPNNFSPSRLNDSSANQANSPTRDRVRLSGQPPRHPSDTRRRTPPLEDFGTRFRREKKRASLLKPAMGTGPRGLTPPSSRGQSIDGDSPSSSLGAESIAPKSGDSDKP